MDLSIWFQLALLIFIGAWVAVVIRLYLTRSRDTDGLDQAALLPLDDGPSVGSAAVPPSSTSRTISTGGHTHVRS
jgi:hypothetical protein